MQTEVLDAFGNVAAKATTLETAIIAVAFFGWAVVQARSKGSSLKELLNHAVLIAKIGTTGVLVLAAFYVVLDLEDGVVAVAGFVFSFFVFSTGFDYVTSQWQDKIGSSSSS